MKKGLVYILVVICLHSCEQSSFDCGKKVYNDKNELIYAAECDSSKGMFEEHKRVEDEHYIEKYLSWECGVLETYDNRLNKHLRFFCVYDNKVIFSIDRYPQYVTNPKKEIVKGNCVIELPYENSDRKFYISYPTFADSVFLYVYNKRSEQENWICSVDRKKIKNRKNLIIMDKENMWKVEVFMYLNSGRKYEFTRELN